jgi:hypothetical protein
MDNPLTYNNSAALRRSLRDLPRRDPKAHLALVSVSKPQISRPDLPAVSSDFSPLIQEFLDDCGYSDK